MLRQRERRRNNDRSIISKKSNLARAAHFFVHFFAVVFHDCNVKLLSYTFYRGNVVLVLVHYFSLPLFFTLHWWPLAFLILSPPLQNSRKKMSFLSLTLQLWPPFSRWASLACAPLSLFLCLSLVLYSKFVDVTITLSTPSAHPLTPPCFAWILQC